MSACLPRCPCYTPDDRINLAEKTSLVTPFPILRRNSRFHLPAPVFSGRQLLWSGREVKRLRNNSRCRFHPGLAGHGNTSTPCPHLAFQLAAATEQTVSREAARPNYDFQTWVPRLFRARRLFFSCCGYPRAAIWCARSLSPARDARESKRL